MQFTEKKERLQASFAQIAKPEQLHLHKGTASNLFRYQPKSEKANLSLKAFNQIIHVDPTNKTLDVEGMATYETIVNSLLPYGLLPTVTPELKHLTIGGVIAGIGIESTGYRYGFVHDGLIEAEVLLTDGRIIVCRPDNEFSDLFYALPNSYGTLGYILRVKIRLIDVKPYVQMNVRKYDRIEDFLNAMKVATTYKELSFIEGMIYSKNEMYLITSVDVSHVQELDDIYYHSIFYQLCCEKSQINLKVEDYIFRYDPDWFWHIPDIPGYRFWRWISPKSYRHSGFYKRLMDVKRQMLKPFQRFQAAGSNATETLIQDWEVPWEQAQILVERALEGVDLSGKPWAALPIKSSQRATLYPMKDDEMYFNLGCYAYAKKHSGQEDFFYTKMLDALCFKLGGIKMLYSSTFLSKDRFDDIYNGKEYQKLKQKYDPFHRLPDLYDKATQRTV